MTSSRWNDAMLEELRQVGDPPADAAIAAIFATGEQRAVQAFMTHQMTNDERLPPSLPAALSGFLEETTAVPMPAASVIDTAQNLFVDHGPEILTALGCYALPSAYAARKGVKVLHQTAYLANRPTRRLFRTMQMVVDVMEPGGFGPKGYGIRTAQKIRLIHAAIRYEILHDKVQSWNLTFGVPINQEDLAGTLLTFSFLAIDGLRKLGASIPREAAEAYLETWCAVGRLLGVTPELIPATLADGAQLRDLIAHRQFAPSDEGRVMTQALIEMMQNVSPPLLEGVPVGLMRLFMEQEVADYLGIPDSQMEKCLAQMVVQFARFVDRDLQHSHWQAMIFRHHILSIIEGLIATEAGDRREFFRLPTHLHQKWRGEGAKSEESLWGHLADWIVSRV